MSQHPLKYIWQIRTSVRLLYFKNKINNKIDNITFSYTDWYQPTEPWEAYPLHPSSKANDLLYLKNSQPTNDAGSLCTVMINIEPTASTNWAKIPCDYPVFRAGAICKTKGIRTGKTVTRISRYGVREGCCIHSTKVSSVGEW